MPLKKSTSEKAFKENIAAEINSGKKPDQAAAIAYSVKREAAQNRGTAAHHRGADKKPKGY